MCLFAFVFLKDVQPRSFFQLESVGFFRSAWANPTLPVRCPSKVFNVRAVTIGQTKIFHQVLHATVWAFHVETGLQNIYLDAEMARSSGGPCLVEQEYFSQTIAPKLGYQSNVTEIGGYPNPEWEELIFLEGPIPFRNAMC